MDYAINSLNVAHDWHLVALAGIVCLLGSLAAISLYHRVGLPAGRARLPGF